ncbi:1-deoxy-D-xylulose 5-phosphate reductoisomerase [Enterococcus moraviensis ATCC BAA-383]|uniref:1-deoxy-D-xylulose 5-phosphate reductoisomerase n=1 Tax=Enterococcus moraviensis ATCC BAA-383 TaxID=1158609 RepID=R2T5K5_9ENTE|nr:1-deoxy-D-xylulose-5-phosphate reductoisomerase [Enterococcus moraviensis]EOI00324.1 1-deoxy-D-xylulose 5-phosphate reductoisomerase [Enterococcus moraviensis ATCC BAA-383]EOT73447.1 1-deoxy-D-xylulose 5-phosphate reductoisomerase [Enterococcus moraviensis ATCC BAA-383]OJG69006.1 1-deoxy-D-xylulose 5-phosphate reductoisomerase [Enterococcus moraviensis]
MKKIALLGATGSIGINSVDVATAYPDKFKIVSLTFHSNSEKGAALIEQLKPQYVGVGSEEMRTMLAARFPDVKFGVGEEGLIKAATLEDVDVVLTAVTGSVGLKPTMAAIERGKDIALANKETLVMAGKWVMEAAQKYNVSILPVDSEHSAIFQCLNTQEKGNLKELVITASGGSFRDLNRDELEFVTLEEALKHPNWSMGKKITIDSSTMMNKGLEVIEAHWLFGIDYDRIKVVLHKESIVHSMIVLKDGAYLAQLGPSDMREPIQYALTYPNRLPIKDEKSFDLTKIGQLNFEPMDFERFPMLELAFTVGKKGGGYPTVYNAANEIAANAFLEGKISYLQIEELVLKAVQNYTEANEVTLEEVIEIDKQTRTIVERWIKEEG